MNYFLLLCGGKGTRFNSEVPKQFIQINEKYVFVYSLLAAIETQLFDQYVIVVNNDYKDLVYKECSKLGLNFILAEPGETRELSVYSGVSAIKNSSDTDIVVVHDSARILVKPALISKLVNECETYDSAIPYKNVKSAIFSTEYNLYISKANLKEIETPQCFNLNLFKIAINKAVTTNFVDAEDDGVIFNNFVKQIHLVENKELNIKLTTEEDYSIIECRLNKS